MPAPPDSPTAVPAAAPSGASTGSAFARVSLLVYALLIVYASWYPFSGWRDLGIKPFDYLWARLPYYWTGFDVWTNVAGYAPLGLLLVLAMHPHLRPWWAVLPATLAGVLLSVCMEAGQTYLPTRVPSNLDLLTNAAGVTLGALLGAACSRTFLHESRLLLVRQRWFPAEASRGLAVAGLWPLALIYPQNHLFGLGNLVPPLSGFFSDLLDTPIDLATAWLNNAQLSAEQYWLADVIVTACGLTGAALLVLQLLRRQAPRRRLVALYLLACIAAKSLACALFFAPQNAFVWISPSAVGGIMLGTMMIAGLSWAPPTAQRRVAGLALFLSLVVTNAVPANPYYLSTLETWVQGKFLNFDGAAQFLSVIWPFLALWMLYHPAHRKQS
ncbi:VanZ family protein [Herbaspirillum seropedicae]|uniref:VanZ family protein n=1 Tax=Herbaspirillum seropedicae TaxID=964 RepID=UPI003394232E